LNTSKRNHLTTLHLEGLRDLVRSAVSLEKWATETESESISFGFNIIADYMFITLMTY